MSSQPPQTTMTPRGAASGMATPNDPRYMARTFFTYEADSPVVLAPTASSTFTFTIAKDSDFFWTKFSAFALVDNDGTTVSAEELPGILIQIQNTTTGRNYMSNPVPLPSIAGSARLPFILPVVTLWEAVSTIQLQVQNITDNKTYSDIYFSFLGIKAFLAPR